MTTFHVETGKAFISDEGRTALDPLNLAIEISVPQQATATLRINNKTYQLTVVNYLKNQRDVINNFCNFDWQEIALKAAHMMRQESLCLANTKELLITDRQITRWDASRKITKQIYGNKSSQEDFEDIREYLNGKFKPKSESTDNFEDYLKSKSLNTSLNLNAFLFEDDELFEEDFEPEDEELTPPPSSPNCSSGEASPVRECSDDERLGSDEERLDESKPLTPEQVNGFIGDLENESEEINQTFEIQRKEQSAQSFPIKKQQEKLSIDALAEQVAVQMTGGSQTEDFDMFAILKAIDNEEDGSISPLSPTLIPNSSQQANSPYSTPSNKAKRKSKTHLDSTPHLRENPIQNKTSSQAKITLSGVEIIAAIFSKDFRNLKQQIGEQESQLKKWQEKSTIPEEDNLRQLKQKKETIQKELTQLYSSPPNSKSNRSTETLEFQKLEVTLEIQHSEEIISETKQSQDYKQSQEQVQRLQNEIQTLQEKAKKLKEHGYQEFSKLQDNKDPQFLVKNWPNIQSSHPLFDLTLNRLNLLNRVKETSKLALAQEILMFWKKQYSIDPLILDQVYQFPQGEVVQFLCYFATLNQAVNKLTEGGTANLDSKKLSEEIAQKGRQFSAFYQFLKSEASHLALNAPTIQLKGRDIVQKILPNGIDEIERLIAKKQAEVQNKSVEIQTVIKSLESAMESNTDDEKLHELTELTNWVESETQKLNIKKTSLGKLKKHLEIVRELSKEPESTKATSIKPSLKNYESDELLTNWEKMQENPLFKLTINHLDLRNKVKSTNSLKFAEHILSFEETIYSLNDQAFQQAIACSAKEKREFLVYFATLRLAAKQGLADPSSPLFRSFCESLFQKVVQQTPPKLTQRTRTQVASNTSLKV